MVDRDWLGALFVVLVAVAVMAGVWAVAEVVDRTAPECVAASCGVPR